MDSDAVVIAGYSCRLPESDGPQEFWQHLIEGRDMVTADARRWPIDLYDLPSRFAKLKDLSRFDASFFEIHPKQAHKMDPQLRLLLEVSYEAIKSAGVDPAQIRGSKTGVYVGACFSDAHSLQGARPDSMTGYENTGCALSMMANRLSYFFDFHGSSQTIDTACSSSMVALDAAVRALAAGECDYAVVGGVNVILRPALSVGFAKLKMLSADGSCRSFAHDANGYARAEGVVAVFLTRKPLARRVIASVLGSAVNNDGYTEQGITFPNGQAQRDLIASLYTRVGIDPGSVGYVEAHGTGTTAGDPQEANALCDIFCAGRTAETSPLWIGSVKSNMGHAEGAAGLVGVLKVLLAMEHKRLPPNLHFTAPNPDIPGLLDGRLRVVTEPLNWDGGIVGINSFGFGGTNAHVILRDEVNAVTAVDVPPVPAIVPLAARTAEGLDALTSCYTSGALSPDMAMLLQGVAAMPPKTHPFRGAVVRRHDGTIREFRRDIVGQRPPVWFVFPGMGAQWPGMGRALLVLAPFRAAIERCAAALVGTAIDLERLLTQADAADFNDPTKAFVGLTAVQIGLVDLLRALGVVPDGLIGHSVGETACGYADGALTAEEAILAAYWRGRCVTDAPAARGKMAAVRLDWEATSELCPDGVVPACHNARQSVTVSGDAEQIDAMVARLVAQGIEAREVNSSQIAFHSTGVRAAAPALLQALTRVIAQPRARSPRWLSTSQPLTDAPILCSAQYYVDNLCNPVRFFEALQRVPEGALVIEIGAHPLMRLPVAETVTASEHVGLMARDRDNTDALFEGVARCYVRGVELHWSSLFAPMYPLTSPCHIPQLCSWDHAQAWEVPTLSNESGGGGAGDVVFRIDIADEEYAPIADHKLGEHVLFPATGYLSLVWRTVAAAMNVAFDRLPVRFNDVRLHRPTRLVAGTAVELAVRYLPTAHLFEVSSNGELVVSGRVITGAEITLPQTTADVSVLPAELNLQAADFYKELRLRGYRYGPAFQPVEEIAADGSRCKLAWRGDWITFLDGMLQSGLMQMPRATLVPTTIGEITIDPTRQPPTETIDVYNDFVTQRVVGPAVTIEGLRCASFSAARPLQQPRLMRYQFIPYIENNCRDFDDAEIFERYIRSADFTVQAALIVIAQAEADGRTLPAHVQRLKTVLIQTETVHREPEVFSEPNAIFMRLAHHVYAHPQQLIDDPLSVIVGYDQYKQLYSDDIGAAALFCDRYLGSLLDVVYENSPVNRGLHLCEIGSGTGGLSAYVLSRLRPEKDRYTLTDISAGFFGGLRDRFADYDTMIDCQVWDLNRSMPATIGGNVDLVLASNALHAVRNLRTSLAHIRAALGDGGFLLFHEVTHGYRSLLSIWGFLDQLWNYDDPEDRSHGAVLTRERWQTLLDECGFDVVALKDDGLYSTLFLCRKRAERELYPHFVQVDSPVSELVPIQAGIVRLAADPQSRFWLDATEPSAPGLVGMVNCLRYEASGDRVRCLVTDRENVVSDAEIAHQRRLDLTVNVHRHGCWGSFRHLPFVLPAPVTSDNVTLDLQTRGDLSTLHWRQAPRWKEAVTEFEPYYLGVNFKAVVLATGRLPEEIFGGGLSAAAGGEFAGMAADGRRVMGFVAESFASRFVGRADDSGQCIFDVPAGWSFEQAATVPVVYMTAYLGLLLRARLRRGERVLIHAGSGGVGQAAIQIAHALDCEIFTTIGSPEKRAYVKQRFPFIADDHIGNSRDTSFVDLVKRATAGRGVDVVLNSLTDDKLQASLRVLARHGRFVEIGKYDMARNAALGMEVFLRDISFHGVGLDDLVNDNTAQLEELMQLMRAGILDGVVQPLDRTVFGHDQVEEAFRYMARGRHIGKVLLRLRDEQASVPVQIPARPAIWCDPQKSYLITGGLGGVGLELADWLVQRGARDIVLVGRSGIRDTYQAYRRYTWERQGVAVQVVAADIADTAQVERLVQEIEARRPVGGIFHLAMELRDALFTNQTAESFEATCRAKINGSANLDASSRAHCFALEHFVVFSSLVSVFGNAGQSNYAYANRAMEWLCERRRQQGYPALAVQWGPIGDVGFVQENRERVRVTSAILHDQSLASCLAVLEQFMLQPEPVVGSLLLDRSGAGASQAAMATIERSRSGLFAAIKTVLGLGVEQAVDERHTLGELGMDSLMAVEIEHVLKNHFDIAVDLPEIRQLSFARLGELYDARDKGADRLAALVATSVSPRSHEQDGEVFTSVRSGSTTSEVLYFVNGFMSDPITVTETVEIPGDGQMFVVHFERAANMETLSDQWLAHIAGLPAAVTTITIFGYSMGSLIAQRFMAMVAGKLAVLPRLILVSPPKLELARLPQFREIDIDAISPERARTVLRQLPWFGDFALLPDESIKRQAKFVLYDRFYDEQLAVADVIALPREDVLCRSVQEARPYARRLLCIEGRHDLRSIELAKVFAYLDKLDEEVVVE
ncbi:MAG: SDR family NAD(P)-dependent oxidoreductase [Gammaproteobacteria bacterium]|nr:SDR family NAD(P)-dependent oxidoreductase [Gammaproteobacteria bacterium]